MKVRDYEVDAENIVNNAVYLHYLEHTRHEFCAQAGISFKEMREQGIDPVLRRVEIEYLYPLTSNDVMVSRLWVEMKGIRFIFHQDIFKKGSDLQVVKAVATCVCIENGKLSRGEILYNIFKKYLN